MPCCTRAFYWGLWMILLLPPVHHVPVLSWLNVTNLCEVRWCLCSSGKRSTTQVAEVHHCLKQRLVLPLVENTDHDNFILFTPSILCSIVGGSFSKDLHIVGSLCTLYTRGGSLLLLASLDFGPTHTVITLILFPSLSGTASILSTHSG